MRDVTFSSIMKELRLRAGLTQAELADKLGQNIHYISNREGAKATRPRRWDLAELEDWADACGFSLDVVAHEVGTAPIRTGYPREAVELADILLSGWADLSKGERSMLAAIIRQASEDT